MKNLDYDTIKKKVLDGSIFIYPTDTLYGIGGNALDEGVVKRIYEIKKREGKKPLSVIMGNFGMVKEYCELDKHQTEILINSLPGPYTFILKMKKKMPVSETGFVGIRVPEHQFARKLSTDLNIPIITTSANISGEKDAFQIKEIDDEILKAVDFVVDMGETKYKKGSTVVDLVQMKILRKGAGSFKIIKEL